MRSYDVLGYHNLRFLGETFTDLQEQRIRIENRARSGESAVMQLEVDAAVAAEKRIRKSLVHAFRDTAPKGVVEWVKESKGIGEPTVAHLLGILGHPVLARPCHLEGEDRHVVEDAPYERKLSELFAYCAIGDPTKKRYSTDGEKVTQEHLFSCGNKRLRVIVHRIAVAAIKHEGPYRDVYDQRRSITADKVHTRDCQNRSKINPNGCGIRAHPEWGVVGSPWRPGHQHNDALRIMGKQVLTDIYNASEVE